MKLFELGISGSDPDLEFNKERGWNNDDVVRAEKEKRVVSQSPRKDSNIEKARRIRTLARMKAKDANSTNDDTSHQYNLGGHVSTWLNR